MRRREKICLKIVLGPDSNPRRKPAAQNQSAQQPETLLRPATNLQPICRTRSPSSLGLANPAYSRMLLRPSRQMEAQQSTPVANDP